MGRNKRDSKIENKKIKSYISGAGTRERSNLFVVYALKLSAFPIRYIYDWAGTKVGGM